MELNTAGDLNERKLPHGGSRLWIFRALALALPLVLLLATEWGLRMAGTGYPASFLVPADRPGMVRDNYQFAWRFFPPALARTPQPILTQRRKSEDTLRVIVFGGSAAMGDPVPDFGMPRILEVLLQAQLPERQVEVINAAVTAVNSHVVLSIARDCRQLDADAWIIYLGNNEVHGPFGAGTVFGRQHVPLWLNRGSLALQRTKLGQVAMSLRGPPQGVPAEWGGMEMFLRQQIRRSDASLNGVYTKFTGNYQDLLQLAPPGKTKVLASTVVTNLRDFPPLVSLHRAELLPSKRQQWDDLYQAGCQAQEANKPRAALAHLERARLLDAEHAELHFRMGQCYLQLESQKQAATAFRMARDCDALRFRADSEINDIIRRVAGQASAAILLDAEAHLAEETDNHIIGDQFLLEHVHFNFHGNYRLARMFAAALLPQANASTPVWLDEETCRDRLGYTTYHELLLWQELRDRLRQPPFVQQKDALSREARINARMRALAAELNAAARDTAVANFRQQIANRPQDWQLRRQFAVLLDSMGDLPGAIEQFTAITELIAHHAESHFRLGALYNRTHEWSLAEAALRQALQLRPDFARAANSLGICLSHQQRADEAYVEFQRAIDLQPTFAEAYYNWGLVLSAEGNHVAAETRYLHALAADANYVPAHAKLGEIQTAAENYSAALPHYREVARLMPQDPAAQLNLGLLYLKMQKRKAARKQLEHTLTIDPGNQFALQGLRQLAQLEDGGAAGQPLQ